MKSHPVYRKLFPIFALLCISLCIFLFVGAFFPQWFTFLEPVVCPDGMHLERDSYASVDEEGNNVTNYVAICTNGNREVDVTWKLLLIFAGVAVVDITLLVIASPPLKKKKIEFDID